MKEHILTYTVGIVLSNSGNMTGMSRIRKQELYKSKHSENGGKMKWLTAICRVTKVENARTHVPI